MVPTYGAGKIDWIYLWSFSLPRRKGKNSIRLLALWNPRLFHRGGGKNHVSLPDRTHRI